jgi:hypothetical protein
MKQRWSTLTIKKKTKAMVKEMDKVMAQGKNRRQYQNHGQRGKTRVSG